MCERNVLIERACVLAHLRARNTIENFNSSSTKNQPISTQNAQNRAVKLFKAHKSATIKGKTAKTSENEAVATASFPLFLLAFVRRNRIFKRNAKKSSSDKIRASHDSHCRDVCAGEVYAFARRIVNGKRRSVCGRIVQNGFRHVCGVCRGCVVGDYLVCVGCAVHIQLNGQIAVRASFARRAVGDEIGALRQRYRIRGKRHSGCRGGDGTCKRNNRVGSDRLRPAVGIDCVLKRARSRFALRSLRTRCARRALNALRSLCALRTHRTHRTLRSLRTYRTSDIFRRVLRASRSCRAAGIEKVEKHKRPP